MSKKISKQIAIYGRGGIGKPTTTSYISVALMEAGHKVMQFGCDPKSDSANTLRDGEYIPSVLDLLRENRGVGAHQAIFRGFGGVYCVDTSGPQPGVGCSGRGIISAVQLLRQQGIFEELELDYMVLDVLGDVICGGFAVPIREGVADYVFIISSANFMAIYAANNLFRGIRSYSNSGGALLGRVIANSINTPFHRKILDAFVSRTKTQIMEYIPRSLTVTQTELQGKTTIEAAPKSEQATSIAGLPSASPNIPNRRFLCLSVPANCALGHQAGHRDSSKANGPFFSRKLKLWRP
jgi:nitrogenase iron protein NifH